MISILVVLTTTALAAAAAATTHRVVFETDISPCKKDGELCATFWAKGDRAKSSALVDMTVVLKKKTESLQLLEQTFWEVSDPDHEKYGKHLNNEDIKNILNISNHQLLNVLDFFEGPKTSLHVSKTNDLISVRMPVERAEKLFKTELYHYQHTAFDVEPIIRATSPYSLPNDVASSITMVSGLRHFPSLRTPAVSETQSTSRHVGPTKQQVADWPSDCGKCSKGIFGDLHVTPEVLTRRYNLGQRPNTTAKSKIAVAEFTQVYYDQDDLTLYGGLCGIGNVTVDHYVGPKNEPKQCQVSIIIRPNLCKEALLDIETIKGVSGTIPLSNYYTSNYDLLGWGKTINDLSTPEHVQSVSYGNDEKQQTSVAFMNSVNVEMQKLGTKGVTVLFASGDNGVSGREGGRRYNPGFPAASPYVTAVGGELKKAN
jgi:tripeptidyl-peptidase-1